MKGFDYSKVSEGKLYDVMRPVGNALEKMLPKTYGICLKFAKKIISAPTI